MKDDQILNEAVAALEDLAPKHPKVWMTARGLARRLGKREPPLRGVSQVRLFELLLSEAALGQNKRRIRNSRFPSVKTLEVLWAATDETCAGEKSVWPPLLDVSWAEIGDAPELPDREDVELAPHCFLSYNSKDLDQAKGVVETLSAKGHSVWFADSRIQEGQNINAEVIQGIRGSRRHLLYLSERALRSLWVGKEIIVGEAQKLEQTIILKGDDPDIIGLAADWSHGRKAAVETYLDRYGGVSQVAMKAFYAILESHFESPDREIFVHPDIPHREQAEHGRLLPLDHFPASAAE